MPDNNNIEDGFNIRLSLLSVLVFFTSSMLVTISLLPLTTALAKNIFTGVYTSTEKGKSLYNLGNYREAIQYHDKALAIDPKNVAALTKEALALDSLGNAFAPGISISNHTTSNNNTSSSDHYYMKANVRINGFNLIADVPTTTDEFQKGLDIKDHLNENQGMLFIFKEPGKTPFWMHGMKFPIDIIWFDKDKNVIHIEHNLQPCITDPYNLLSRLTTISCPSYSPEKDALYVLETTAGFYQRHNVKVSTHMDFSLIK